MKRLLPLLLVVLLLTACGTAPAAEPDPVLPTETEPDPVLLPETETSANNEILPAPAEGPDEDELPILTGEEGAEELPALSDTEVTLDGRDSYLRVTLPEGWTWEQAEGPKEVEMRVLYPENDPDFKVEMRLWNDGFAMCGTGVTSSKYTLPDGQKANIAYEIIGDSIDWTLILPESPDSFTIQFATETAVYEAHRAELELMLGTIRLGVLAGLDVVTTEEATG